MKEYDIMVVGPVSLDHNIDYLGNERKEVGGAVVASGFAAAGSGAKTAIFCKSNAADADVKERFAGVNADPTGLRPRPLAPSATSTSPPTRKSGPAPLWACATPSVLRSCLR